jgi:hypothetical protein
MAWFSIFKKIKMRCYFEKKFKFKICVKYSIKSKNFAINKPKMTQFLRVTLLFEL